MYAVVLSNRSSCTCGTQGSYACTVLLTLQISDEVPWQRLLLLHCSCIMHQERQQVSVLAILLFLSGRSVHTMLFLFAPRLILTQGHASVVALLVEEHGANVDARDGASCTPLHAASEGGYPAVVESLLRSGAEIDCRNGTEQTPLHYACWCA